MSTQSRVRNLVIGVALILGIGAFYSLRGGNKAPAKKLLLYTWSNYFSEDHLADFTKQTGIEVEVSYIASNEELLAKMKAGASDYDIIMPSDYMVRQMATLGMLLPLDKTQLPNFTHIDPAFHTLRYDPGLQFSIPFVQGTTGLAINTEKVKVDGEVSWKMLFESPDTRHTSLLDDIREVFAAALMYDGRDLNDKTVPSLQKAAKTIGETKKRVALFSSEPLPLLMSGEVTIAHTYSTHGVLAGLQNEKIKYFIPKEGATIWTDNFAIPKTSKRSALAHQFINYFLTPEVAVKVTGFNRLATPNLTVRNRLPASELKPEIYPPPDVRKRLFFMDDLGESITLINRLWTEVKS